MLTLQNLFSSDADTQRRRVCCGVWDTGVVAPECGPLTKRINITWALGRKNELQVPALPPALLIQNLRFNKILIRMNHTHTRF